MTASSRPLHKGGRPEAPSFRWGRVHGTEEAIRALNRSSLPVQKPRHYQIAHDYLMGRESLEISEERGLSRGRVNQIVQFAVLTADQERVTDFVPSPVLTNLSARVQNALAWRSFGTDEGVRRLVGKYGSAALLVIPNLGRDSHEEICRAFGFDPNEKIRLPGLEKEEADKLRAMPNRAQDRNARNYRLLYIFEADPDLTRAAEGPKKSANQSPEESEVINGVAHPYNGGDELNDWDLR